MLSKPLQAMVQLNSDRPVLLGSAYFPPVDYFVAMANSASAEIEQCESYVKQSYRNRCKIFACDGVLSLTIPVLNLGNNAPVRDIRIDYSKKWLLQHKRALVSAYMSSPFFEYYQDDIFRVLDKGEKFLFDLNMELTQVLMENIGIEKPVSLTREYLHPASSADGITDLRESIHPKKGSPVFGEWANQKPYYQVFSGKYGFIPGLSVLDLLFNEGPEAETYLRTCIRK